MRPIANSILEEIEKVIVGKRSVLERVLLALLAGGHILLDDVPGVGKTTLAVTLGRAVGLACRRVQCSPDLLPSDLTGFSVYDRDSGSFVFKPGALQDTHLLLADEINRASSRTQSALLEAMEEKQVTVDGITYPLQEPFLVIATENSVGTAGTQPLPFAQMDRFLMRLSLGYPDYEAQMAMLRDRQQGNPLSAVTPVVSREDFLGMQREVARVTCRDSILDYITRLTMASREQAGFGPGISPRGALFLDRAAKAHAWLEDRDYVTGADVQAVFPDVCAHRVLLSPRAAEEGATVQDALRRLLETVETSDHRRGI